MISRSAKRKWFFIFVIAALATTSVISVVVFSARRQRLKAQEPKEWLTSTPRALSKVKDLEIVNVRIVRPGTDVPGVAFQVLNKSNRGVMAVMIACGNASISKDGLEDEENPVVIIEPYGTLEAEMNELTRGAPIVISSATFQDAKEEGDTSSLELMQKLRGRERARRQAERERQTDERGPNQ